MNILIPDIWLRKFLNTATKPEKIKEYLSLCGPSVERIYGTGKQAVYDIEITGNRPDAMSVIGVAREAAAILPRFGMDSVLSGDPYARRFTLPRITGPLTLTLTTDPELNPRWMSVVFDRVSVKESPAWLRDLLVLAGMRTINNVVDITNYLMRAYGQPAHVFDYDQIRGRTMMLRASRTGEVLTTLDGKKQKLPGGDIVIADGSGRLIDLCGIMGGENSSVTADTTRVVLFLQTYSPAHIRRTSMALAHRTEAAALFEKGLDTELVGPVFRIGMDMMTDLTGGKPASDILDIYPKPYIPARVTVPLSKIQTYIGAMKPAEHKTILTTLGFGVTPGTNALKVRVPSFRRDVARDVDIIEELARIHGYHLIPSTLPDHAPPPAVRDPLLVWEEELKIRLRDWGYTEFVTYSMISERQMELYGLDKDSAYRINNPLSDEWVYMRPGLWPSFMEAVRDNLGRSDNLTVFELSNAYRFRKGDLPVEYPTLVVAWSGIRLLEARGLAEALFDLFGIPFPEDMGSLPMNWYREGFRLGLGTYGSLGVIAEDLAHRIGLSRDVTVLELELPELISYASPQKRYVPVPNHPPSVEDLAFAVPEQFAVGPLITMLKLAHEHVRNVTLLDVHGTTRTLHITYQRPDRTLTNEEIAGIRNTLLEKAKRQFGISLR